MRVQITEEKTFTARAAAWAAARAALKATTESLQQSALELVGRMIDATDEPAALAA